MCLHQVFCFTFQIFCRKFCYALKSDVLLRLLNRPFCYAHGSTTLRRPVFGQQLKQMFARPRSTFCNYHKHMEPSLMQKTLSPAFTPSKDTQDFFKFKPKCFDCHRSHLSNFWSHKYHAFMELIHSFNCTYRM